jgi:hypothetical protein
MDLLGMVEIAGDAWCAPDNRRTKRIEPMRGSAIRSVSYSVARGALPLRAHPQRYA